MIGGSKKIVSERSEFSKKVGVFLGEVIAVNPDEEWFAKNGMELKEGSKETEYLGESKEGNTTLRIKFWVKEEGGELFPVTYFLEDKEKVKQDGSKKQYINSQGTTTWADKEENLVSWFKNKNDYRVAKVGEDELYNFMKCWLDDLDFQKEGTMLNLDWKKLMNGNVIEIRQQVKGEYAKPVVLTATVKTKDTPDGVKEYQGVFNKAVTQHYNIKVLRTKNFTEEYVESLKKKKSADLKGYERFVVAITGKYGCKDFYSLKPLHEYDPSENPVGRREPLDTTNADY